MGDLDIAPNAFKVSPDPESSWSVPNLSPTGVFPNKNQMRAFLVVQRQAVLPAQGAQVQSLVRELF